MTDAPASAQAILDQAIGAAKPVLVSQLASLQASFVQLYGNLTADKDLLAQAFSLVCQAKLAIFESHTDEDVLEARQAYELSLDALERLGLATVIVGEAKAGGFLRQAAHLLVTSLAAGAGAAVCAAIEVYVPVFGIVLGPMAGAGIKAIIDELAP